MEFSFEPVCDQDSIMEFSFELVCDQVRAISTCQDRSNLVADRFEAKFYYAVLVADRLEAGRRPASVC